MDVAPLAANPLQCHAISRDTSYCHNVIVAVQHGWTWTHTHTWSRCHGYSCVQFRRLRDANNSLIAIATSLKKKIEWHFVFRLPSSDLLSIFSIVDSVIIHIRTFTWALELNEWSLGLRIWLRVNPSGLFCDAATMTTRIHSGWAGTAPLFVKTYWQTHEGNMTLKR